MLLLLVLWWFDTPTRSKIIFKILSEYAERRRNQDRHQRRSKTIGVYFMFAIDNGSRNPKAPNQVCHRQSMFSFTDSKSEISASSYFSPKPIRRPPMFRYRETQTLNLFSKMCYISCCIYHIILCIAYHLVHRICGCSGNSDSPNN
jgi:hypothetical protein